MSNVRARQLALPTLLCLALATASVTAQHPDADRGQGREGQEHHEGGPDRPIRVDCAHGGSIGRALEQFPERTDSITIEISGFCEEALVISRKVILRGSDPNTDGISGPPTLPLTTTALINVHGVSGFGTSGYEVVRFEHLSIVGSPNLGLAVNTAQLGLSDVTISHHTNQAMLAFQGGSIYGDHVRIVDNNNIGLNGAGGHINCVDCELTNNNPGGGPAAVVNAGSTVILLNAAITGRAGVQAVGGGNLLMIGGTINAQTRAVSAQQAGQLQFRDNVQVTGSVICSVQGLIDSRQGPTTFGLHQLSNASGGNNQITNGCFMMAGPGTTILTGQTTVSVGAYVGTEGGPAAVLKFGALSCSTGGKVTTTGGNVSVNNVPGIPAPCGT